MGYIEFPGIGINIPINREAFNLFGLPVYWYGIIISFGFFLAVILGMRNAKKAGIKQDDIIDLVLLAAPLSIVGARFYYVILNWEEFKGDWLKIINIRTGGIAIYGALIVATIVAIIFAKVRKINILHFLDYCIPYFVLAQAIGRWGNFVNQEAFGTNTTLPWGMTGDAIKSQLEALGSMVDPSLPVHPTFLYESLWNFAVFFFLIWFSKRKKLNGEVFCLYMITYGAGRAWIEGLRLDSLYLGNIRMSQFLSAVFIVFFGAMFIIRRIRCKGTPLADNSQVQSEKHEETEIKNIENAVENDEVDK